jgi:hypothetical protein
MGGERGSVRDAGVPGTSLSGNRRAIGRKDFDRSISSSRSNDLWMAAREIEAADEREAIEKAAKKFEQDPAILIRDTASLMGGLARPALWPRIAPESCLLHLRSCQWQAEQKRNWLFAM